MKKHYTGVGSRSAPREILALCGALGEFLDKEGYTLRSGGANGCDQAFEKYVPEKKDIFLPWEGFNGYYGTATNFPLEDIDPADVKEAEAIVKSVHPAWERCSQVAKKLHTRNAFQILGFSLDSPSEFVLCYTENGRIRGGTGTAIRLALKYGVPVWNMGIEKQRKALEKRIGFNTHTQNTLFSDINIDGFICDL